VGMAFSLRKTASLYTISKQKISLYILIFKCAGKTAIEDVFWSLQV
jgi:hypothetical protein